MSQSCTRLGKRGNDQQSRPCPVLATNNAITGQVTPSLDACTGRAFKSKLQSQAPVPQTVHTKLHDCPARKKPGREGSCFERCQKGQPVATRPISVSAQAPPAVQTERFDIDVQRLECHHHREHRRVAACLDVDRQ
eukprot:TRINITY_DN40856_c0_g1_i1.p2 TRINITY_DN40856_c0_g1~~TRINITY_DN40856_c0_g1_i1.p2  ORF type:complete len:144 (+),score=14.54 TRINITY_DN40856_c0_g1_i1:26-433(+)